MLHKYVAISTEICIHFEIPWAHKSGLKRLHQCTLLSFYGHKSSDKTTGTIHTDIEPVLLGQNRPIVMFFKTPRSTFWQKNPFSGRLTFYKNLSPFVILELIWLYIYKENCVPAGYRMLSYVDFTFALLLDITFWSIFAQTLGSKFASITWACCMQSHYFFHFTVFERLLTFYRSYRKYTFMSWEKMWLEI